jgi:hypothetical protein
MTDFFPPAYFTHGCFLPLFDATEGCVRTSRELMLSITTPDPWVVADTWVRLDFLGGRNTPKFTRLKSRYIRTYILHTYTHTYTHTYIKTYIHTCIHTHIYVQTCIHACMHTDIHTYTHTYIHTYIRTCVHTHIYIHIYIHTYIHVHLYSLNNYWKGGPPQLSSVIIWEKSRMQRFESRFFNLFNFTRDKKVLKVICSHFYILCYHFM